MEEKFKVGDTVRLKSGGPVMTVNELKKTFGVSRKPAVYTGKVDCKWFIDTQQNTETFHQDALDPAEPDGKN